MSFTPKEIYTSYLSKLMDKTTTLDYFISYIENSNDEKERLTSINYMSKIDIKTKNLFKFLESLLVSDSNRNIRGLAGRIIILNYFQKGKRLINWALDNEKSEICLNYLIDGLSKTLDNQALLMLINLAYRVTEKPLINTIIKAIGNRPEDKNILFDTLLNEYWKTEKVEILTNRFQEDLEVKYFKDDFIVYESDTLLITPVKEAIKKVLINVFFINGKKGKSRAKTFLEQRDSRIDKVWDFGSPIEMLNSASALSEKCFVFFKDKTAENLDFLLNQFEYRKGRGVRLPYLNNQALQYLFFLDSQYLMCIHVSLSIH